MALGAFTAVAVPAAAADEGNGLAPDQEVGKRFVVNPHDLPPPNESESVANKSKTIPRAGHAPRLPQGFTATPFATGLADPRRMLVLADGAVLVAEQEPGYLTLLRDDDGDGKADTVERQRERFDRPYGLAWRRGEILVADQTGIWRLPYMPGAVRIGHEQHTAASDTDRGQERAATKGKELLSKANAFGAPEGHDNRPLAVDPVTGALFAAVGSTENIGEEPAVKASIQRFDADGSNQRTYASGLRNATGLAFNPETHELFATVEERDGLGDRLVPDYLTHVKEGGFYGWPYAYIGSHPQPGFADKAPDKVKQSITPDLLFEAHSSAMDVVFYAGDQFPPDYKGDAFVALKGSWNRAEPTGYKVVRVPFEHGKPKGGYENFMTGFWVSGTGPAHVWGRPAALAVAKDGALLVADDAGGSIWRISYSR
jgi:glucose/arabinose dehydrogenase